MDRDAVNSADVSPVCATAIPSVLETLRGATSASHRNLEALQPRLLAGDITRAEYSRTLERMYGIYEPLGQALLAHDFAREWGVRMAERTELLRRELLDLGLMQANLAGLTRCRRLPPLDTPDRALGCAYVFEGSTLGGRVICKHLSRVFADRAAVPLRFFAGDGARTADNWRRFCGVLNDAAGDVDEVCAAACAAFDAMAAWLSEPASAGGDIGLVTTQH
jgi:heme oxygenase